MADTIVTQSDRPNTGLVVAVVLLLLLLIGGYLAFARDAAVTTDTTGTMNDTDSSGMNGDAGMDASGMGTSGDGQGAASGSFTITETSTTTATTTVTP